MTQIVDKDPAPATDYYTASLEHGALQLTPHCACGNVLNEDYFCEKCQRKCRCNRIICSDPETLEQVKHYILKSSQFSGFKATLAE